MKKKIFDNRPNDTGRKQHFNMFKNALVDREKDRRKRTRK